MTCASSSVDYGRSSRNLDEAMAWMSEGEAAPWKIRVGLDEGPTFEAYTYGRSWNGWACPWFDRSCGEQVLAWMCADGMGSAWGYDDARRVLWIVMTDGEREEWAPSEIGGRDLYPIGAGGWCWSEEEDA